jgi:hypothetical protein
MMHAPDLAAGLPNTRKANQPHTQVEARVLNRGVVRAADSRVITMPLSKLMAAAEVSVTTREGWEIRLRYHTS